jgi:pimeloyl-ACP methyl ester carboxylesterase
MKEINGHLLYVIEQGPGCGPPVVLLHHGLGSVRAWKDQIPALAEAGYRVIAYDRWGYGRSDARAGFSMPHFNEDMADLEVLLSELEAQPAFLIGHSDGGNIALSCAARYPERVAGLVVVAAHIYVEPQMIKGIEDLRQAFENDAAFRQKFAYVHGDKAWDVFDHWYRGWANERNLDWDMRPLLKRITCPTLVVQGLEDEHATPQQARDTAAAIPGAELWLEPGAGHMLPQDIPQIFNRKALAFMREKWEERQRV